MKKRSLLAAGSLAAGVALSLTAPHAHAGAHAGLAHPADPVGATVADSVPVGDAGTVSGTGIADSLLSHRQIVPATDR
ncbi:hypothetical protein ACIRPK_06490 [Kitasatospora sp. NPDC101801]|uniref:hypothetical protein n=1 Tax=Kitasatospora sp. NPDC101801 TaxID=3364103 RepID=UPI0037F4F477